MGMNAGDITMDGHSREQYLARFEAWLADTLETGERGELITSLLGLVSGLVDRVTETELRLRLERAAHAGRRTEKLNSDQLSMMLKLLGEEAPAADDDRLNAVEEELTASEAAAQKEERERAERERPRGHAKRQKLPAHLPRDEHRHQLSPGARACGGCGKEMMHIGNDTSEMLAIIPARFVVKRHIVSKYACGRCKDAIRTAPRPPKPVPGGIADASLLAHIACAKYLDHIPLQRLRSRYGRDGVDIPISTLADQVAATAELVAPLLRRIKERVLASHVVQTDASGLKVLDPADPDGIRRGTMWCYVGDRRWVLFEYRPTAHGEDGPWAVLADRTGYIQADADNTFDRLFNGRVANATEVGCWAHARRKLFKLKDVDHRVAWPLKLIGMFYRVEKRATRDGLTVDDRRAVRQRDSRVVLSRLFDWYIRTAAREPPASALGKACRYAIKHRKALECFLDDGALRPDNNFCELQIRSLAVGRKNYLFGGSDAGAERAAALYSLLRTAVLHGVSPQEYLADVLTRLAVPRAATSMDDLLPDAWLAARTAAAESHATQAA